ncbi:50S ribosomal protein L4 [Myxococcota bacterium]|nr:50S ribosomal protein L4 [Myxococcota bacterium]
MPTVPVFNQNGQEVSSLSLPDSIFSHEVNQHVMWTVVRAQLAARRAGTHATKTRRYVSGGGRKPFKQKGTGGARQGSIRAPNHVGGGKAHTPHPRDYTHSVNKKVRRLALISALSLRVGEKKLVLLDNMSLPGIKTKSVARIATQFGAKKALLVDTRENRNLILSTRNLASHKWLAPEGLNVYDLLNHDTLIMQASTASALADRLSRVVR